MRRVSLFVTASALLLAAPACRAQAPADSMADSAVRETRPAGPSRPDSTERHVKPFFVMARSALVPGWGQVYNRHPLKAALVVAGEGFLTYKIFQELKRQNEAIDRITAAFPNTPEYEQAVADELTHRNRKVDWIWWTAAAHLLQMADAYVDAHFLNFDAEFGPDDDRAGSLSAPRASLALRVNF